MVQLGVVTVHFRYRSLSVEELRLVGTQIFEFSEALVRDQVRLEGSFLVLELEEGTLKARHRIFATAVAVGTFLGSYGDIREGAVSLGKDLYTVGSFLVENVPRIVGAEPSDIISTRRSATLARRIETVLRKVENGETSSENALKELLRVIDPDQEGVADPALLDAIGISVAKSDLRRRSLDMPIVSQELLPFVIAEQFQPTLRIPAVPALPPERPHRPRRIKIEREDGPDGRLTIREE